MGPHAGSQHIEGVFHIGAPIPHGLADRVLQGAGAGSHRHHFGPQKFHTVHVQGLADGVFLAHVHFTFQAHESRHGSGSHPVLSGTGFGDDPFLAHFLGQEALAQGVVDLVGPGVVQVFPFQINLGSAQILGHLFRIVQQAGPVGIVMVQGPQFLEEFRIILEPVVGFVQLQHCVHQGFRYILAAVSAKSSIAHDSSSFLTALTKARILFSSFVPAVSMPLLVSTPKGWHSSMAARTFSGSSPPARKKGLGNRT